jgi:hypothetical protein
MTEYAPFPPGFQTLDVAEISHVARTPDGRALIWMQSTAGLKVCLAIDLIALERAVCQIEGEQQQQACVQ